MANVLRKSFSELKRRYPFLLSVTLISLTILIVYWRDLSILANEAIQNEALTHIFLIPFLLSYLIYRKRYVVTGALESEKIRRTSKPFPFLNEIAGSALVLSAFLLYWYGSYTFYPLEYHLISLPLFIVGTVLVLFNSKMLFALVFPIMFLLFLIPPPSAITYEAGAVLGNLITQAAYTMLKIFGLPVNLQSTYGSQIIAINTISGTPFLFAVDLPCSGVYSLIAFTMFATFLAYIVRGPIAKRLALFPVGLLMLITLNILRISLLASIAYQFGEAIAMTIFHTISGWLLIFIGMTLLLLMSEKILHLQIFENTKEMAMCPRCDDNEKTNSNFCIYCGKFLRKNHRLLPNKFWTKIIALLLVSYILTLSVQAPVFAFAQGLTLTNTAPEMSTNIFPKVPDYQLKFLYRDQDFEKIASQDASLMYAYISQNIPNPTIYVLVGVANSINNLHSWEVCFTWQTIQGKAPLVNILDSKDVQITQNPLIIARYFTFQHPANYTQVTLYWFQKALFKTGATIESKYTRISLIILAHNPNDSQRFEQRLVDIGKEIAEFWEPLKNQSLVSLGVPTIQVLLGSAALLAIFVPATQYARELRKRITHLKIFDKMSSTEEKLLYKAIRRLQETRNTTTQNIILEFERATGRSVTTEELTHMLTNLEKTGIIRQDLANARDQPRLVWKT